MTTLQQAEELITQLSRREQAQLLHQIAARLNYPGRAIVRTPGVVGGSARIDGSRIPVWVLVNFRKLGLTDKELLEDYPSLIQGDLNNAWAYFEQHKAEIEQDIFTNENR